MYISTYYTFTDNTTPCMITIHCTVCSMLQCSEHTWYSRTTQMTVDRPSAATAATAARHTIITIFVALGSRHVSIACTLHQRKWWQWEIRVAIDDVKFIARYLVIYSIYSICIILSLETSSWNAAWNDACLSTVKSGTCRNTLNGEGLCWSNCSALLWTLHTHQSHRERRNFITVIIKTHIPGLKV